MTRTFRFAAAAAAVAALVNLPACAAPGTVDSLSGPIRVETVARGLENPWGMAFLPDGRMLVTERPGRLRVVTADGAVSEPLAGVPEVFARSQGGLLDVALHPDFASNRMVYVSYAEPGPDGASTAVARGRLTETALEGVEVIFRMEPKVEGGNHFGSRLVFAPDGNLFVTLGERAKFDPAQDLSNHMGTIVRITPDGAVPPDNPFVGQDGALPEIWSYGHRNIQAAAIEPGTGALWEVEHGPRGGDELNRVVRGGNYGWPLVSWGNHYTGGAIDDPPTRPDLLSPAFYWESAIAPSGMTFYTGDRFPDWRGNVLVGGLRGQTIVRVAIEGEDAREVERLAMGVRIRDVVEGPDGAVYALSDEDNGAVLRLVPDGDERAQR
ncbi:PQQ-dependent sugar dehydrogenase [Azospirillum halopraeferens]|uniref:PQQ-dependent sugar dehydrogenase n=1 Tax=Azospirillum halopraeferens TaxID=34010 RepID=UPI000408ADCE|nr:PQQ-dependent sugar dehydrogenase [Azospirillum halopraeferens]